MRKGPGEWPTAVPYCRRKRDGCCSVSISAESVKGVPPDRGPSDHSSSSGTCIPGGRLRGKPIDVGRRVRGDSPMQQATTSRSMMSVDHLAESLTTFIRSAGRSDRAIQGSSMPLLSRFLDAHGGSVSLSRPVLTTPDRHWRDSRIRTLSGNGCGRSSSVRSSSAVCL